MLASREHDTSCILIKSEIDKPHLQTCHIRIDCPIKKNGFTHIVTGRGFNCTSLPSRRINTLDTLQRNWFLCLSERVVNYPLSWRHKKRLQREIRSRLDLRYGRFFTDISNEWLIISTDLSNSRVCDTLIAIHLRSRRLWNSILSTKPLGQLLCISKVPLPPFCREEPAHFRRKELMIFILCRAVIARGVKWS